LQSAHGALEAARTQTRSLTILSPVNGTVVSVGVNPGESIDVTAGVATVVNLDRVRVLLNVPADTASEVAKGMVVSFTVEGGPAHSAVVSVVARAVDPATNTVQVEALAGNADRILRDDGFAKATIYTHVHRSVIVIPSSALVDKDGKATVFLAGADGTAQARAVQVGAKEGDKVEIVSGLKKGDLIVTTGAYELDDGTRIKIAK
jgi:membrane fusion protein (multidrug efflux system)